MMTLVLTSVTGVFGASIGVLAALLFWRHRDQKNNILKMLGLDEEGVGKTDEEPYLIASLSPKDILNKATVVPFKDIIVAGKSNQKIEILSKISRHYLPEFAPILLQAKRDERNNIRVLTASILSKIKYRFMRQYKNLKLKHAQYPESSAILLNLARHTSAYADCGVLDAYRQKHFRELSIQYFKQYLKLRPTDKDSLLTLAKIYLRNGQPEESLKVFRFLTQHKISLNVIDLFWYLETLYETKHFDLIRQQIALFDSKDLLSAKRESFVVENILKPWLRGNIHKAENLA